MRELNLHTIHTMIRLCRFIRFARWIQSDLYPISIAVINNDLLSIETAEHLRTNAVGHTNRHPVDELFISATQCFAQKSEPDIAGLARHVIQFYVFKRCTILQ